MNPNDLLRFVWIMQIALTGVMAYQIVIGIFYRTTPSAYTLFIFVLSVFSILKVNPVFREFINKYWKK